MTKKVKKCPPPHAPENCPDHKHHAECPVDPPGTPEGVVAKPIPTMPTMVLALMAVGIVGLVYRKLRRTTHGNK